MRNLLLIICLTLPLKTLASGIPVVDIAAITQVIMEGTLRAQEFEQNMQAAKNRLSEMKSTADHYKEMVDGHFNYEDILNAPSTNDFMAMEDWKAIYHKTAALTDLRKAFNMHSKNPHRQRQYDRELIEYDLQKKSYDAAVERNQRMQSLLGQFSTATTPAAKEDIANAISFEQTQIQNDTQMAAAMNTLLEKQDLLEHEAQARENIRIMMNEGFPLNKKDQ